MGEDRKLEAELVALEARIADELADADDRPELASALERRARLLGRLGRFVDCDQAFAAMLSEFAADDDPVVADVLARARYNRALFREKSGELTDALVAVDALLIDHDEESGPEVDLIVSGLALRARLLWKLDRRDEAIALYAETFERYRDEEDLEARRDLARMLLEQASRAKADELFELELQTVDSILSAFADEEDSRIRKTVSRALFRRAVVLRKLDRPEEAVVVWGSLWERSKDDPDPPFDTFAVTVLFNEAVSLGQLGRQQEAAVVLDDLIDRFVDDQSADVAELVAGAVSVRMHYISVANDPISGVPDCDRLLARIQGSAAASVQLAASEVLRLKMWELLGRLKVDEAIDVARQLTGLFADERDPALVKQRGDHVIEASRMLCYHPRFVRVAGKFGTRVALNVGDRLGSARRARIRARLPRSLDNTAVAIEVIRRCQDQAVAMLKVVVGRTAESRELELVELAARARHAWGKALGLRLHPVQVVKLVNETVTQGEAASRLFQTLADKPNEPLGRAAVLAFCSLLAQETDDPAERVTRLRNYRARFGDSRSVAVRILVLEVRVELAYESIKGAILRRRGGRVAPDPR